MRALLGGDATADTVYLLVPGGCRKVTPPDILAYCPTISQSRIADWGATGSGRHASPRRSEEHTSELQSLMRISYAVFCLKKKKKQQKQTHKDTIHQSYHQSFRLNDTTTSLRI